MDTTQEQNTQSNPNWENPTTSNANEFVEKKPLISEKGQKKLIIGGISCIGLIVLLIIGYVAYKNLTSGPINSNPTPPPVVENPVNDPDVPKPMLAYVKNAKEIWVVDENGEGKTRLVEISPSVNQYISAMDWYDMENLSYSRCDNTEGLCGVEKINLKTKAISNEFKTRGVVIKMDWSADKNYVAYIEDAGADLSLRLKAGTVTTTLSAIKQGPDPLNENARVFFTPDSQVLVWSSIKEELIDERTQESINYPIIEAYRVNGVKMDEIKNGSYPMYFENNQIIYVKDNGLVYRVLGRSEDSAITPLNGKNPRISPDLTDITYWRFEDESGNVTLGLYDSERDLHKNILRGVVFPTWLTTDKIAGIEIKNCQDDKCELYQFQTNNLVILDISSDRVQQIDQGKIISSIVYFEDPANTK